MRVITITHTCQPSPPPRYVQLLCLQESGTSPLAAQQLAQIPAGFSAVHEEAERRQLSSLPSILDDTMMQRTPVSVELRSIGSPKYTKVRVEDPKDHLLDIPAGVLGEHTESSGSHEEPASRGESSQSADREEEEEEGRGSHGKRA